MCAKDHFKFELKTDADLHTKRCRVLLRPSITNTFGTNRSASVFTLGLLKSTKSEFCYFLLSMRNRIKTFYVQLMDEKYVVTL